MKNLESENACLRDENDCLRKLNAIYENQINKLKHELLQELNHNCIIREVVKDLTEKEMIEEISKRG
jgi:hypothetical protein